MATKTKKRRPKIEYLPWEEARALVQSEMIPSRQKYDDWFAINQPKVLPRHPNRVYKEFTTWNDFLGNKNLFKGASVKWRDINEATVYIHSLKIPSQPAWMEWVKLPGNLPPDIPARPDLTYSRWVSWNHWLGNKIIEATQAKQEAKKIQIFYMINYTDVPGNVVTFGLESAGITGMKEMWERKPFNVVKMFWFDAEKADTVKQIVEHKSTPYLGYNNQRIVPNMHELAWDISMLLDTVT